MILAITGHRLWPRLGGYYPNPLGRAIQSELKRKIELLRPSKGVVGMATGTDQWSGWIFVRAGVPFVAAVPFVGQELVWPKQLQERYHEVLEKADEVHVVTHLAPQQRADRTQDAGCSCHGRPEPLDGRQLRRAARRVGRLKQRHRELHAVC